MSRIVPLVLRALVAASAGAVISPLTMVALWALLSGDPGRFVDELGSEGVGDFVLSQQRFFAPVMLAGLGAHVVLVCLHRFHPLVYAVAFYCIGAIVYMTMAVPQIAAFTLDPPVVRTLLLDAFAWWAPAAVLSGLVFWTVAARPLRREPPLPH